MARQSRRPVRNFRRRADWLGYHHNQVSWLVRVRLRLALRYPQWLNQRAAWAAYQDQAEAMINQVPDAIRGPAMQIGLILVKAWLWRRADEPVNYLREVIDARWYADNMAVSQPAYGAIVGRLNRTLAPHFGTAEFLQANSAFEEAISAWIEREQRTDLSDRQRALVNLHLLECYQWGLEDLDDPAEPEQLDPLEEMYHLTLESTLSHKATRWFVARVGIVEQRHHCRLSDDMKP